MQFNDIFRNVKSNIAGLMKPDSDESISFEISATTSFFTFTTPYEIEAIIEALTKMFIKLIQSVISPALCLIFNSCFENGCFLNCLKIAKVNPVYKSSDKNLCANPSILILSQLNTKSF